MIYDMTVGYGGPCPPIFQPRKIVKKRDTERPMEKSLRSTRPTAEPSLKSHSETGAYHRLGDGKRWSQVLLVLVPQQNDLEKLKIQIKEKMVRIRSSSTIQEV